MANMTRVHMPNDTPKDIPSARRGSKEQLKWQVGRNIFKAMVEKGWIQADLVRASGVAKDSVSSYVNGKNLPTPRNLQKLAAALGKEVEDLMPNYLEGAVQEDITTMGFRESTVQPDRGWLTINRMVFSETANEIQRLLIKDRKLMALADAEEAEKNKE